VKVWQKKTFHVCALHPPKIAFYQTFVEMHCCIQWDGILQDTAANEHRSVSHCAHNTWRTCKKLYLYEI